MLYFFYINQKYICKIKCLPYLIQSGKWKFKLRKFNQFTVQTIIIRRNYLTTLFHLIYLTHNAIAVRLRTLVPVGCAALSFSPLGLSTHPSLYRMHTLTHTHTYTHSQAGAFMLETNLPPPDRPPGLASGLQQVLVVCAPLSGAHYFPSFQPTHTLTHFRHWTSCRLPLVAMHQNRISRHPERFTHQFIIIL